MSTLRLLLSDSYDPWFNLAVEECIFRQMPATQRVLFLWRNADTRGHRPRAEPVEGV